MLSATLAALVNQSADDFEVIVADNRSERSPEIADIVGRYPDVRLLALPKNLGFTGGMNAGLGAARGEFVYLTEDDVVSEPDCLSAFTDFFSNNPDAGLASGILLDIRDDTIWSAGGEFSLGGVFCHELYRRGEKADPKGAPFQVAYIPGSMIFARTEFLRSIGGFRREFFMYMDDIELCSRVAKSGRAIWIVSAARARHFPPIPGEYSDFAFHKYKNLFATYLLHAKVRVWPEFFFRYVLLEIPRAMAHRRLLALLRACSWLTIHAPRLLLDRKA